MVAAGQAVSLASQHSQIHDSSLRVIHDSPFSITTHHEHTMRFMIIRKADSETETGMMPSQELLADMGKYLEDMVKAGVFVGGDGLKPSSRGARIRFAGGKPRVIDGPFTETKELVAGYTLIEVGSREEAVEWVKRWPTSDGHGEVELELRELYEVEDFPEGEGLDQHIRLREQLEGQ